MHRPCARKTPYEPRADEPIHGYQLAFRGCRAGLPDRRLQRLLQAAAVHVVADLLGIHHRAAFVQRLDGLVGRWR